MAKNSAAGGFPFPMKHTERLLGWIYLVLHIFIMEYAVSLVKIAVESDGSSLAEGTGSLIYFGIGFVFVLIAAARYLRDSFRDLMKNLMPTVRALLAGFLLYFIVKDIMDWVVSCLAGGVNFTVPTLLGEKVASAKLNPGVHPLAAALLAPVVEEVLFRGVAFGTIRGKSRVLAYLVSVFLFALYHLWQTFLTGFDWNLMLYMLEYVPAGVVLCMCYEQSKSVWGPIFLHIIFNFVTVTIAVG